VTADHESQGPTIPRELWRPESTGTRRSPSLLRERPRQLALIGCLALIIGMVIQPYATGSEFEGTTTQISIAEVPDAGLAIILAVLVTTFVLSRGAAESRQRIVLIAPVVLAATILSLVAQIVRQLLDAIDGWLSGGLGAGPIMAGVGAILAVIGTAWMLVRGWPATVDRGRSPGPGSGIATERVGSGASGEAIGVLVGGAVGFLLAVGIVAPALPVGVPLRELFPILVVTLGGVWLGSVIGRRLGLG
jgi:hypothetical protein